MHKKFDINWTKIKGGCQSGRKMVTHDSKSYLPLTLLCIAKAIYLKPSEYNLAHPHFRRHPDDRDQDLFAHDAGAFFHCRFSVEVQQSSRNEKLH